jgi:selenocysteine lyase/cysteine desulfurase
MTADEQAAYSAFVEAHPVFAQTHVVDELRRSEYARLDAQGHVYLDYTGGSLYAESQVREHVAQLTAGVFGNPHSANPASVATTALVERARAAVLEWFGASPAEYTVIFTANCTGALKLIGESFPFGPAGRLLLTADNHNSVNGIREFASGRGAHVDYVPLVMPDLRIDRGALTALLASSDPAVPNLFVFPAQSNFTGVVHPLDVVDEAHARGWTVVLDAAAFVATSRLDLGEVRPDFVTVSFYKMFGYPTGVGALVANRRALARLGRPWFSGGTVHFATVAGRQCRLSPGEAAFEDGTLDYLSIPAVEIGLRHLANIGIDTIHTRVICLTEWLLRELVDLRHASGRHMVRIYGPIAMQGRGGTVTLNLYDPDGHLLDYRRVEELAGQQGISVRTGCFCNPGAGEAAEGLSEDDILEAVATDGDMSLPRFLQFITHKSGKSAGALRVSLGIASTFGDVYRFRQFVGDLRDQTRLTIGEATFDIESCRVIRDGS